MIAPTRSSASLAETWAASRVAPLLPLTRPAPLGLIPMAAGRKLLSLQVPSYTVYLTLPGAMLNCS